MGGTGRNQFPELNSFFRNIDPGKIFRSLTSAAPDTSTTNSSSSEFNPDDTSANDQAGKNSRNEVRDSILVSSLTSKFLLVFL